jgi:hypothetical protein
MDLPIKEFPGVWNPVRSQKLVFDTATPLVDNTFSTPTGH